MTPSRLSDNKAPELLFCRNSRYFLENFAAKYCPVGRSHFVGMAGYIFVVVGSHSFEHLYSAGFFEWHR